MTTTFAELEPNVEPLGPARGYLNELIEAVRPKAPFESFTIEETTLLSQ
jgi:hypothetical protein